jgi:flagellar biosynthesis GTPase FlhF
VAAVLAKKLEALPLHVREPTRIPIGSYRGLTFGVIVNPNFPPDVYLEGAMTRLSGLSKDHQGPRAVLNALERIASGYGSEIVRVRQDLSIAESQLRDYQARLGQPFPHEAYLSELTGLRDQLKAGLSAGSHEPDDQTGPSVSELASRIKALKAANTIEATPQRVQRKQAAAEEPITARIRRRQEAGQSAGHDAATEAASEVQSAEQENSPADDAPGMAGANGRPMQGERIKSYPNYQLSDKMVTMPWFLLGFLIAEHTSA